MALTPCREVGSTSLQTYSEFDPYGTEAVPVSETGDHAGPNEPLEFTRRIETWASNEHTLSGVHDTLKIPKLHLVVDYDYGTTTFSVRPESYCMGTRQRDATVFTISSGGAGEITVAIGASYALPSTNIRVHCRTPTVLNSSGVPLFTQVSLRTITSATSLAIRRREGSTVGTMALTTGPFALVAYSE